jgi:hypothetical protein
MTEIMIPDFNISVDNIESFSDSILKEQFNINFPVDPKDRQSGAWFNSNIADRDNQTDLEMNFAGSIWKMSTKDVDEANWAKSNSMISILWAASLQTIIKKLADQLPAKLKQLGWCAKSIDIMTYNPKKFTGINKHTQTPMYGAPACTIVVRLNHLDDDTFVVCKRDFKAPVKKNISPPITNDTPHTFDTAFSFEDEIKSKKTISNTYGSTEKALVPWTKVVKNGPKTITEAQSAPVQRHIGAGGGAFKGRN